MAEAARVKQLVLSHLYPLPDDRVRLAEVARHYAGPVLLAEDGLRFLV
jgi:ribonuclease BN (tRNA processing enzyme)